MSHLSPAADSVVVAVLDGDGSDQDVIEVAAEEASRWRAVLRLLWLHHGVVQATAAAGVLGAVRGEWPGLRVEETSVTGSPADVLARAGADARLLVVPQTVVPGVLDWARCPVLVVPDPNVSRWHRLVVAVVQERPDDEAVLTRAADEARLLGSELRVVHAYPVPLGQSGRAAAERGRRYVFELLAGTRRATGPGMTAVCAPGPLEGALARHAAGAELVVLGDVSKARLLNVVRRCGSGILLVRQRPVGAGRRGARRAGRPVPLPRAARSQAARSA